jgi:hypothetical protein
VVTDALAFDHEVRAAIARAIREGGRIPRIAEVALALGADERAVEASFVRMIEGRVFIPEPGSREILAYDPFCVGPTPFAVRAGGREWWGICGWDALGIPPALGTDGTLTADCADGCGTALRIDVAAAGGARGEAVLHVGVPARSFWDDIYFT